VLIPARFEFGAVDCPRTVTVKVFHSTGLPAPEPADANCHREVLDVEGCYVLKSQLPALYVRLFAPPP